MGLVINQVGFGFSAVAPWPQAAVDINHARRLIRLAVERWKDKVIGEFSEFVVDVKVEEFINRVGSPTEIGFEGLFQLNRLDGGVVSVDDFRTAAEILLSLDAHLQEPANTTPRPDTKTVLKLVVDDSEEADSLANPS